MLLLSQQTPHILFAIVLSAEEKIYKNSDNFQEFACNSLDFIVYKTYAYDMKKNKKIQKKQVKTAKLPGLIALLVLSILLLVAYFMKDYNPGLQKEAEGFTKLKQDFLDLQKEFNKVDTGWTYHEGCRGKGGVYNDDEASSCRLLLTSRDTSEYTLIQNHFEGYVQILTDSGDFTTTDMTKEIMWSISDPGDMTKISSHTLRRSSWPDANCSLRDFFSSDKANGGIELECDHSSHYFRYPRYDK